MTYGKCEICEVKTETKDGNKNDFHGKISHKLKLDGTVVEKSSFSLFGWFWGIVNFFYLLVQTLINPNYSKHGDKYVRDFRPPGQGPPKPPSRKFGGFGPSGGPSPPPMGGCGCGG